MQYQLVYTARSVKDVARLDAVVKRRIAKSLQLYRKDPVVYSQLLAGSKMGQRRFRVGDYRIIFDIRDCDIVILRIGHRRDIYK